MDLKEMALLETDEGSHWYYTSKSRALLQCLDRNPTRILDVGAGSGYFAKMLLRRTSARGAVCVDPGYTTDWSETQFGKTIAFQRSSPVGDADLVLLMDVIEHVDDDVGLIRTYADRARIGTRFVVSVPAFSWLWSPHDEFLEHRRRYTLGQAMDRLSAAGLTPVAGFYFYGLLFFPIAALRLWRRGQASDDSPRSDLRRHHPIVNRLLGAVCTVESAVAPYNRLFGLTAFAVAEKI